MAEYISREGAIERIQPHVKPTSVYGEGYMQAIGHAVEILSLMPAADVQPVKRGKWIENAGYGGWSNSEFKCPECGIMEYKPTNFCPHCGARMER